MSHFREQLVCAMLSAAVLPLSEDERVGFVEIAQTMADTCCEAWGHPWNDREPNGKPAKGASCIRCGKHA